MKRIRKTTPKAATLLLLAVLWPGVVFAQKAEPTPDAMRALIEAGALEAAMRRLELARARQELAANARVGYDNVGRAQSLIRVREAAEAQAAGLLRRIEARRAAGAASDLDVLRARTQLRLSQQGLINARSEAAIAKSAFANLLGIDPSTPVRPPGR